MFQKIPVWVLSGTFAFESKAAPFVESPRVWEICADTALSSADVWPAVKWFPVNSYKSLSNRGGLCLPASTTPRHPHIQAFASLFAQVSQQTILQVKEPRLNNFSSKNVFHWTLTDDFDFKTKIHANLNITVFHSFAHDQIVNFILNWLLMIVYLIISFCCLYYLNTTINTWFWCWKV